MAEKTFNNLQPERRKEIVDTCVAEFAANDFESASIARIIKKLNLARGSFYRYFESKAALYGYLYQRKIDVIEDLRKTYLQNPNRDFFDSWLDFGIAMLKAEAEHPDYLAFLARVTQERRPELFGGNVISRERRRMDVFGKMIEFHRATGQLRTDISVEIETLFLLNTREGIRQYLAAKYKLNIGSPDYRQNPFFQNSDEELHAELADFVRLLRDALENPGWKANSTNTRKA